MRSSIAALVLMCVFSSLALAAEGYPHNPDAQQSPGSLCRKSNSHRYPEKIPYCHRSVSRSEKWQVIDVYEKKLGYQIRKFGRGSFKIDHVVPLCMGGSNERNNLWPQHSTVYVITDPIEGEACNKMAAGRLNQARAVDYIQRAKRDLSQAPQILREIRAL